MSHLRTQDARARAKNLMLDRRHETIQQTIATKHRIIGHFIVFIAVSKKIYDPMLHGA